MIRRFFAGTLVCAALLRGQLTSEQERLGASFKQITEWIQSGDLAEAEKLLREVLPLPQSEPKQPDQVISAYGLGWVLLITGYLSNADHANAERVLLERVGVTESLFGPDHLAVTAFLEVLANVWLSQGKLDPAIAAFERCARIQSASKADHSRVDARLAEALLAKGQPTKASELLKVSAAATSGVLSKETILNPYAVALRESGQHEMADQVEQEIEAKQYVRPGVNQQERDFLRARLATFRGKPKEAEVLYKKWIRHWEVWGESVRHNRREREWDRILMTPLEEYWKFLHLQGRREEAAPVRARLRAIQDKYEIKFR